MRCMFIVGTIDQRHAQDGQLAATGIELGALADGGEQRQPALGDWRAVEQRLV